MTAPQSPECIHYELCKVAWGGIPGGCIGKDECRFYSRPAPAPEKPCLTCRVPQMNNGGCCLDETNCIDIANWERASDPYKVAEHDAAVAAQAREKVLLTLIERIEERKIAKWGESERDAIFRSIESLREAQR